jgi:hypothetical protein
MVKQQPTLAPLMNLNALWTLPPPAVTHPLPPPAVVHPSRLAAGPSSSAPAPSSLAMNCKNSLYWHAVIAVLRPPPSLDDDSVTGHCMTVSVAVLLRYKNNAFASGIAPDFYMRVQYSCKYLY